MNSTKQSEILLKAKKKFIYEQYSGLQQPISNLIVDVCREENMSPEKVFLLLLYKTFWCRVFACQGNSI